MGSLKDHAFGDNLYPETPGFKAQGTSREAAKHIAHHSSELAKRTLAAIRSAGAAGMTADEAAAAVGATVLAIRPRVSELLLEHKVRDSGCRRKNVSGRGATVWIAVD